MNNIRQQCNTKSLYNISIYNFGNKHLIKESDKHRLVITSKRRNLKGRSTKYLKYAWHLRGMPVDEALIQMRFARSIRGYDMYALIRNCQANAVNQFGMNPDHLVIKNLDATRAKQPKTICFTGKGRARYLKLRHTHLVCKVYEDRKKAGNAWRGSTQRVIQDDRCKPHIVID